jgi:MFS family permease
MQYALATLRRIIVGPAGGRFFSFWIALAVTNLGTWAGLVALQLRMLDLTGDQAYVSAVLLAEYVPAIVLGTVLGSLLDRVPPRSGLAICELVGAVAWALMVTTGRAGTIVALALICGVATGIFKIVSMAVAPMLVDDDELDAANGSILAAQALTSIVGVAIGGALVGLTSANVVLLLNAVTFAFSAAVILAFSGVPRHAPPAPDAQATGAHAWLTRSLAAGRRSLQTPTLRMVLFSLPVASIGLGIAIAAIVPTLRDTYGATNLQTGAIMALDGLGVVIGTSIPSRYAGYLGGMALLAIGWGGFGIAPSLLVAAPLSVIGGMGNGIVTVRFRSMVQRATAPHERVSSFGFAYAVTFSMIVVGQVAVVPLVNGLGQRATFTMAGTIFALAGFVAALCWPRTMAAPAVLESVAEAPPVTAR